MEDRRPAKKAPPSKPQRKKRSHRAEAKAGEAFAAKLLQNIDIEAEPEPADRPRQNTEEQAGASDAAKLLRQMGSR